MPTPARSSNLKGQPNSQPTDLLQVRVEEFLMARSLSPNSQKAYRRELQRFRAWIDKPWSQITPRHITQYKEYLHSSKLAASSVNRALAALKSFFGWFKETYRDAFGDDPTKTVSLNKLPSPPARDLSDKEVAALQEALLERPIETRLRDTALFCVLLHGLRAGEVARS